MSGANGVHMRRAFVGSMAAGMLAALIMLLIAYSHPSLLAREKYVSDYAAASTIRQLFDNTAAQLANQTGVAYSFAAAESGYANATFNLGFAFQDASGLVSNYSLFLQDNYSSPASALITPDFSAMDNGRVEIMSNTTVFYADYATQSAGFTAAPGVEATGMRNLSITFVTSQTLNQTTPWSYDEDGDINVTVSVQHAGGTNISNGLLDSSLAHYYWFNFTGTPGAKTFMVFAGNDSVSSGVAWVNVTSAPGSLTLSGVFPYWSGQLWYYNATLAVDKGAINRTSKVITWEGG